MKSIKVIPHLEGVKVMLCAEFNVPMSNGAVADDFRLRSALPTIEYLRSRGAKVIMIGHLQDSEGENLSLEPVAKHFGKLGVEVSFIKKMEQAHEVIEAKMQNGDCVMLENLRYFKEEKANDPKFAQQLASLADIYVNEAFSVSHRAHASIVGVPQYIPGYAGLQLETEVANLSKAFQPSHPFVFILGGAKFETKIPLMEKFMSLADTVFVGGALANDFFKAKGYEVGVSRISKEALDLSKYLNDPKLMLPLDVVTESGDKDADKMAAGDKNLDVGSKTLAALGEKISQAKFVLWNGPLGIYEDGKKAGTLAVAKMIADVTEASKDSPERTESVIGGGDTLAAVAELGLQDKFTFISTAGGAMLDFLSNGTLPGIEALNKEL